MSRHGAAGHKTDGHGKVSRLNSGSCSGAITGTTERAGLAGSGGPAAWLLAPAKFRRKRKLATFCAALGFALPLLAQTTRVYPEGNSWVEETSGTLPDARELRITTDLGSIDVRGKARGISYVFRKRAYTATKEQALRQFQIMKLTATRVGAQALVDGRMARHDVTNVSAEISLQVPSDLKKALLETGGGSLTLRSIGGAVAGRTGGGAIKLEDIAGPVSVSTGGGDVVAGSLGSDATIKAGGGSIRVDHILGTGKISTGGGNVSIGSANGLLVNNGAGNIDVKRCNGDLQVSTGGGRVTLGPVMGTVKVEAGAGSVRLAGAAGRVQVTTGGGGVELFQVAQGAQVDTGSGAVTVEFTSTPGSFTDSSLHTAAGDVLVFLPANLALTVHASSDMALGYGIRSEFDGLHISKQSGGYGPQSMWAEGALNGGGPSLRVRTGMGHIDFRSLQSH